MEVRATRKGFHNHRLQEEGAVFAISSEKEFSDLWMEKLDGPAKASPSKASKSSKPAVHSEKPVAEDVI